MGWLDAHSWLNQVELWFAKIERDVIARRVYLGVRPEEKAHALHPQSMRPGISP